jgi:large subunit ribosomal protein L10
MPISKAKKKEIVKALGEKIAKQKAMVFVDFTGLKVKDLSVLKNTLRASRAEFKVAKKTLLSLAFKEGKIPAEPKEMAGEIALVLGYDDQAAPAKIVYEFSKLNKNIKILGGYLENKMIGASDVLALALLPSRDQLLAKLVGSLSAPARNLAIVMQANLKNLVYVLSKVRNQ